MKKQDSKIDKLTPMVKNIMDQIQISNSSRDNIHSPKAHDHTTSVLANKRDPPLEGVNHKTNGGMWTLKHETSSPKFYELLINTELKGDTSLDLNNLYNHIKMCLNVVTRLQ